MILDMFKKKDGDEAEETPVAATAPKAATPKAEEVKAPKGATTPEELEAQARMLREKQRLEKVERLLRQIYQEKKDCYLVLAKETTLDELASKEKLRPLIAPLNQKQRFPVIRVATTEAVAGDIARALGSVCEERPLVAKVTFVALLDLMTKLAKAGIFNYVIVDGADVYVDQISHAGFYFYGDLKKGDGTQFFHYMNLLESLHAIRVAKLPFYILPAPNTTQEMVEAGNVSLGLIGSEKTMVCPIFTNPKMVVKFMKEWKIDQKMVKVGPEQLKILLADMQKRVNDNDFPVLFGGMRGANIIKGKSLIELTNDIFRTPQK